MNGVNGFLIANVTRRKQVILHFTLYLPAQEWLWDCPEDNNTALKLFEDNKSVIFHPINSAGTAVARGSKLLTSGIHYWELKVVSPIYGTAIVRCCFLL